MQPFWTNKSKVVLFLIILILVGVAISDPPHNILSWDVFGHYLYLPALFIYNDLGFKDTGFVFDILEKYNNAGTFYHVVNAPAGNLVIKYTSGLAILYLPFFLLGHLSASILNYPADGFSVPYQYSVFIGCLIYSILGLIILRKVLREYFNENITAVILVLLFLGTNYFAASVFKGAMAHNLLFTLYASILWLTIQWHKHFRKRDALLLGLACGLASMARPSDIVCILIPLLWGIKNWQSGVTKVRVIFGCWPHLLLAGFGFFLAWSPQFLYWKTYTGQFLFYTYDNPGEGFEFLDPYITQVLFSFRKGWLVYTPMMIFAIAGFFFLYKNKREIFLPLTLYFIINFYIVASWSCWWYAESFGQRALVQSYTALAIVMGFFIQFLFEQKGKWIKIIFICTSLFFIFLNIFQTWQVNRGILHGSRVTKDYYMAVFLKTETNADLKRLLLVDRPDVYNEVFTAKTGYLPPRQLFFQDFENMDAGTSNIILDSVAYSGRYSCELNAQHLYSPGYFIAFKELTQQDHAWIRASVLIYPMTADELELPLMVATFSHDNKYYKYKAGSFKNRNMEVIPQQWNLLALDYLTPEVRSKNDVLSVYLWFRGKGKAYIDDLRIEIIEPEK